MTRSRLLEEVYATVYGDYAVKPYISEERDLEAWLAQKPLKRVPRANLQEVISGILPGDIILLWLINFGTFTTEKRCPRYFEYTYGIDARQRLEHLVAKGYVVKLSAKDSLPHVNVAQIRDFLGQKGVKGLSGLKREDLIVRLLEVYSDQDLEVLFKIRGYALSESGRALLAEGAYVVDKHPKKSF